MTVNQTRLRKLKALQQKHGLQVSPDGIHSIPKEMSSRHRDVDLPADTLSQPPVANLVASVMLRERAIIERDQTIQDLQQEVALKKLYIRDLEDQLLLFGCSVDNEWE